MMKSRFLQMICFFLAHDKNVFAFIKMSVSPSGPIKINQTVSIQCALKDDTVAAFFYTSANVYIPFCGLSGHTSGAECKPSDCAIAYNASCLNDTIFIVQYPVPLSWKGTSVYCRGLLSDERSNEVKLTVQDHGLHVDPPSSNPIIRASPPGFQYDIRTNITSNSHIIEITAGVVGVVMFVILFTVLVVFVWRDRSIKMEDMSENKSDNKNKGQHIQKETGFYQEITGNRDENEYEKLEDKGGTEMNRTSTIPRRQTQVMNMLIPRFTNSFL